MPELELELELEDAAAVTLLSAAATTAAATTATDTATAIAGGVVEDLPVINGADTVVANTNATFAEAATMSGIVKAISYSISDEQANIPNSTNGSINEAINITITDDVTFAQAKIIDDGSNSGSNTYSVNDTPTNLSNGTVTSVNALNGAQAVTASSNATAVEAAKIAAISQAVTYNISDTAANIVANVGGLNEAVDITISGNLTFAKAELIKEASNSGTKTYVINDTAAIIAAAVTGTTGETADVDTLNGATTVTANTSATFAEATTIAGIVKTVSYSISDEQANIPGSTTGALNEAINIVVTNDVTFAQAKIIDDARKSLEEQYPNIQISRYQSIQISRHPDIQTSKNPR